MMPRLGTIYFALGLLGNHVRWLLWLDPRLPNPWGEQDLNSKLEFIQANVYPPGRRTWNNWLGIEWQYRAQLDQDIRLDNQNWNWEAASSQPELYLNCHDIQLPWLHYYHLNLGLNNSTPESMLAYYSRWQDEFAVLQSRMAEFPNRRMVYVDSLFSATLDPKVYQDIVEFFGLDNQYHAAQQVHCMHYECRRQSARDFVEYFTGPKFHDLLENVKIWAQEPL